MIEDPRCENCRHYKPGTRVIGQGECRCMPPCVNLVTGPGGQAAAVTGWPTVPKDAFCGMFAPRRTVPHD